MFVYYDMEIVTSLRLALMDQDADVVDTAKTLGLFKVPTALDCMEELVVRNRLHDPSCFRGKLMGRYEKYSILIVQ